MDDDAAIADLEARYPGWGLWVSDTGAWWASRRAQLTLAGTAAGLVPYLRAETADELEALLAEQDGDGSGS